MAFCAAPKLITIAMTDSDQPSSSQFASRFLILSDTGV